MNTVEVRCPVGPKRLFSKLKLSGGEVSYTEDNLIEFACADCRKALARDGKSVDLVLHQYSFIGELISTVTK